MFRSKKDVDAHVRDVFSKCKSENERLKLCFGIAKQYASIREFESARRYLDTYVNSNPANPAEAHKFMGDILLELGDAEKALDSYKLSYTEGKGRDSLNRVCDLLSRGAGIKETAESKKQWFDMQKSSVNNNPISAASSTGSSPVVPRRQPVNIGGPPKSGFNHSSFTNGSPSPLLSSNSKTNGGNVDLQLRYLERRFDDGLGKILDQNTLVLEQMLKMKEEMKDLGDKVDQVAVNQEQMQIEIRDLKEKQRQTQELALENKQNYNTMQHSQSSNSCRNCEGRPVTKEVVQVPAPCHSADELTALKVQMDRLEKLTVTAIEHLSKPAQPQSSEGTTNVPLSQLFKKPEGSWNCDSCYCSNNSDATSCIACQVLRPGFAATIQPPTAVKPTILSNFSFGFPPANPSSTTAASAIADPTTPKKPGENKDSPSIGSNLAGKFSFADLAKNNNSTPTFSFGTSESSFSGTRTTLDRFGSTGRPSDSKNESSSAEQKVNISANAEEGEDDFVPTAEFQPVIPLPPLVEVKKGDENENTIAEYRAKLYRFISESKEWKERGVGNIKLLQSKEDPKKCRVVMWRERIGKLACNFSLYPDIKVTNYQNNPKVLCWKCQDFAEDSSWETFTLRFGNEENCANFKREMERLAKLTVSSENPPSFTDISSLSINEVSPDAKSKSNDGSNNVPLSQLFKKPEGSWNCTGCYCSNNGDASSCIACQAPRPGFTAPTQPATSVEPTVLPTFSFGFPSANSSTTTIASAIAEAMTPKKSDRNKDSPSIGINLSSSNRGDGDGTSPCPGCIGCNPETYIMPDRKLSPTNETISYSLAADSSMDTPSVVSFDLFSPGANSPSQNVAADAQVVPNSITNESLESINNRQNEPSLNNSLSNFSFSFASPEKSSPISFQFKTPTFSFKPTDGNASIFGGSGSIFTPPVGGNPPGSTPSPFVSPLGQQSLLNNSASSQTFNFTQQLFKSPVQGSNNEENSEQPEDEYEDVDDDDEDDEEDEECMFQEDARVYIKDDATDSSQDFSDKGDAFVRVLYDGESFCSRLVIMVDGETAFEHFVASNTSLEPVGEFTYEWTGIGTYESPVKSRIRVVFSDQDTCEKFAAVIADSRDFAKEAGITEAILLEEPPSDGY